MLSMYLSDGYIYISNYMKVKSVNKANTETVPGVYVHVANTELEHACVKHTGHEMYNKINMLTWTTLS